jgi:SAM-dependent methyltransferase
MSLKDNKCGFQQRAFDFYWSIREGFLRGRCCLAIGSTNCASPGTLGTDKYADGTHPEYGGDYAPPAFRLDADERPYPFYDERFGVVMMNHVIEHLQDPMAAVRESYRLLKQNGVLCIITPDMAFNDRGVIDKTHTEEFAADDFYEQVNNLNLHQMKWESFNTLDNHFSFEAVIRKGTGW